MASSAQAWPRKNDPLIPGLTAGTVGPISGNCSAQRIEGNGKKYYLHLLTPEQLRERGMGHRKAQLVIEAYPVLVLSDEWLEELFCPHCGTSRWCHITRLNRIEHTVRWAPRDLWQQVAHVDPLQPNPTVSEYTRRSARRPSLKRADGQRFFDPG